MMTSSVERVLHAITVQGRRFQWQAYIVETFVSKGGIAALQNLISAAHSGQSQSVALIEAALGVIAAVSAPII
jgi:hypothetical protein